MSRSEIVWRVKDFGRQELWRRRQVLPSAALPPIDARHERAFTTLIDRSEVALVGEEAQAAVIAAANDVLAGRWQTLGVRRDDMVDPDWFLDPVSSYRFSDSSYAFRVGYRRAQSGANVSQVWDLSRHHHLTLLATAWWLTRDDRYADRAAAHLHSWWRRNPFLSGVNWSNGIELGIRLISWVWVRRLLDEWSDAAALFENNDEAVRQVRWHQEYLAAFGSRGTSANNHVIAEAAGQLIASCGFPWFRESEQWRTDASRLLERELNRNTFASGLNRELASDYHGFVAELGLLSIVEASAGGHPLSSETQEAVCRMFDAAASIADESVRPPRQGDSDDGRAIVLDAREANRWASLLACGASIFGAAPWWPKTQPGLTSALLGSLAPSHPSFVRPGHRSSIFADAGLTILRTPSGDAPEIWCRCDGGPHGYLAIAAHAHADALSVEVRSGGVDILADPGTYCYHGQPEWRRYFRSSVAHNTLEIGFEDQSVSGGPFLWLRHADAQVVDIETTEDGEVRRWIGVHSGYGRLKPPATHCRKVSLNADQRQIEVVDWVETKGSPAVRMAFHLGPAVDVDLAKGHARLSWPTVEGRGFGSIRLPTDLKWSAHRGELNPILGWYSERFGMKKPTTTLLGVGRCRSGSQELRSVLQL